MRKDAVPPELALAVFARDAGCMAPRLGGTAHDCAGRLRIEHVKAEPRMGKRAEPRMDRLLTLCEGHTEPGMRAGYVWATDRANRAACRAYLAEGWDAEVLATARGRTLVENEGGIRQALMAHHPDNGGDAHDYADVQAYTATEGGMRQLRNGLWVMR